MTIDKALAPSSLRPPQTFFHPQRTRSGRVPSNNPSTFQNQAEPNASQGGTLKTKARSVTAVLPAPVWCHRCSIRIAPYDSRSVSHGKIYHRDCYVTISHEKAQARRN
jgi:hypothetical protein